MRELRLDGNRIQNREDFYQVMREQLEVPEYFGDNLDALHDFLEEHMEETSLTITHFTQLSRALKGRYTVSLLSMLTDSGVEIRIRS